MKKLLLSTFALLFIAVACEKDPAAPPVVVEEEQIIFNGNQIGSGIQEFEITKSHILKKGTYLLKGWVYVTSGATLTIEPGTIIKGDKETKAALIVERGAKIIAQGSKDLPIVFTSAQPAGSRKPGDWGGLVVCGKATNNKNEMIIEGGPRSKHGGNDDSDNSGVISFVRVEFAGYPFKADQEINGLTLGSVGSGTKIDHVQVSYSNDDSFEWFGGTVNAKYLISYHGWDDDFDTDSGFRGNVQFGLIVRNPKLADKSISNGFESDNNSDAPNQLPITRPVFSNITSIGAAGQDPQFLNTTAYIDGGSYNPNNGSKLGQHQAGIQIRRGSNLHIYNSALTGFPVGIMICNDKGSQTQSAATDGRIGMKNVYIVQEGIIGSDKDASFKDSLSTNSSTFDKSASESFSSSFFKLSSNKNTVLSNISELGLKQPNSLQGSPNWGPVSGSLLTGKNSLFTEPLLTNSFFDKVDFIGAFRGDSQADNWTAGWANFNPQQTTY
jgi:hypothetical protein